MIIHLATNLVAAYGFDSGGGACEQRASRRGRAQLLASIPCDLSTQSYCNLPGSAYPWHAVRRFVHENQGLMKRMYGDIKHISVLKNEFEGNFIETDDVEIAIERYSQKKQQRAIKFEDKKNRRSDTIAEPHFRLQSTAPTSTTSSSTPTKSSKPSSRTRTTTATTVESSSIDLETTTKNTDQRFVNVKDQYIVENETKLNEYSDQKTTTTSTVEDNIKFVTLSNDGTSTTISPIQNITTTTPSTTLTTPSLLSQEISLEELEEQQKHKVNHNENDKNDEDGDDLDFSDRSPHPNSNPPTMEGQLFQDTVQKETPPPVNVRGV